MNKKLSKPVAWTTQQELIDSGNGVAWVWLSERALYGEFPLYSQEYVSALLAELEAKTKHIADMEHVVAAAKCDDELWDAMAHRLKTLEDKLATPVRLPEKFSMLHRTDFHEDYHSTMAFKSVEVFDAIRAAGFKCVGDE